MIATAAPTRWPYSEHRTVDQTDVHVAVVSAARFLALLEELEENACQHVTEGRGDSIHSGGNSYVAGAKS